MSASPRNLVEALRGRGLVHQVTDEALGPLSARESLLLYNGFDPTAPSLHAGSLFPVMILAHAARAGHRPVALIGGGTGLVGDPSGREAERPLADAEQVRAQVEGMGAQIKSLLAASGIETAVVDNAEWLSKAGLMEFLRDVGKHFSVNAMMAKESVRARLEDRDQGISFTEFAYMLLQAYDYYRLWKDRGCRLQTGGSDQWGNITAGIELIRRKGGGEAYGLTCPLLLTADGKKFGKSAGNAVWLDPAKTSPYRFFQFWMNQEDAQAASLLAAFTLLPMEEVAAVRAEAAKAPEKRVAQRRLAAETTAFVHGKDAADRAEKASRFLFGEVGVRDLDEATLVALAGEIPTLDRPSSESIATTFAGAGLVKSNSEYRRLLAQGAIYVNDVLLPKDSDLKGPIRPGDLLFGRYLVLRRGKRDYALVRVVEG
jgi:tyrosyl-tRNA synthetase